MIPNRYKGKYFSILGDSISTLQGYSEPEYAVFYDTTRKLESGVLTSLDTWWGQVIEQLGGGNCWLTTLFQVARFVGILFMRWRLMLVAQREHRHYAKKAYHLMSL